MINYKQRTSILSKKEAKESVKWLLFNAEGKTLGRFAAEIAKVLRGKHRVDFTPHVDCGDGVVIVNADKIRVTGSKEARKVYRKYTGYIGGLRETPYRDMLQKKPTYILEHAIKGMMPKTRLGKQQLRKLRIYAGPNHRMQAQTPVSVNV